jgi:hypothetical protein
LFKVWPSKGFLDEKKSTWFAIKIQWLGTPYFVSSKKTKQKKKLSTTTFEVMQNGVAVDVAIERQSLRSSVSSKPQLPGILD